MKSNTLSTTEDTIEVKKKHLLERLKSFNNIIVTGPQRSGTTISTKMLAEELQYECFFEEAFDVHNAKKFELLLEKKGKKVVQCPALSAIVDGFNDEDTIIVFLIRDIESILRSEKRINWNKNIKSIFGIDINRGEYEKVKYIKKITTIEQPITLDFSQPIAHIKYQFWNNYQKNKIKNYVEIRYDELEYLFPVSWINANRRRNFDDRQTSLNEFGNQDNKRIAIMNKEKIEAQANQLQKLNEKYSILNKMFVENKKADYERHKQNRKRIEELEKTVRITKELSELQKAHLETKMLKLIDENQKNVAELQKTILVTKELSELQKAHLEEKMSKLIKQKIKKTRKKYKKKQTTQETVLKTWFEKSEQQLQEYIHISLSLAEEINVLKKNKEQMNSEYVQLKTSLENIITNHRSEISQLNVALEEEKKNNIKFNTDANLLVSTKSDLIKKQEHKFLELEKLLSTKDKLLRQKNNEVNQFEKERRTNTRLQQEYQSIVSEKDNLIQKQEGQLYQLGLENSKLKTRIRQSLEEHLLNLESWRWKAGNSLIRTVEVLIGRKKPFLAVDKITQYLSEQDTVKVTNRGLISNKKHHQAKDVTEVVEKKLPNDKKIEKIVFPQSNNQNFKPIFKKYADTEIDIIVPIFNALPDVKNCIYSIKKHSVISYNLILINDGSEPETKSYLDSLPNVKVIHNKVNKGYTKSINIGLKESKSPYKIILNSDTIVSSGWLIKIKETFERNDNVGIVGCLSNAASYQSVPYVVNPETKDWYMEHPPIDIQKWAELVENVSPKKNPEFPIVNGFCFALTKTTIDAVGYFDEQNFPIGYGEENDYCLRTQKKGLKILVADDCFIFHAKSKSFSHAKRKKLSKTGSTALKKKHGANLSKSIELLKNNTALDEIRKNILAIIDEKTSPSIAYILPATKIGGGVISVIQCCKTLLEINKNAHLIIPEKFKNKVCEVFDFPEEHITTYQKVKQIPKLASKFDVLIGTHNSSVKYVKSAMELTTRNICPMYFVQDYEPWFYDENSKEYREAFDSYASIPNITCFAKTQFLVDTVKKYHPKTKIHKIAPGFDKSIFKPKIGNLSFKDAHVIGITAMIRPRTIRRAPQETLRVLQLLKEKYGERIHINTFGCTHEELEIFPELIEFDFKHSGVLRPNEVFHLLTCNHLFLDMSVFQGFGRTGLEAMAAGCIPILPKNCGTSEYAINNQNALLVDTSNQYEVLQQISNLIDSTENFYDMSLNGLKTASTYNLMKDAIDQWSIIAKVSSHI